MKKAHKKLTLTRSTVTALGDVNLGKAAGGTIFWTEVKKLCVSHAVSYCAKTCLQ